MDDVMSTAAAVRHALTLGGYSTPGLDQFPRGCCGIASELLGRYLTDTKLGSWDYVAGEAPRGRGTHGWVDQGRLIVDITADQFDDVDSPVIVTFDRSWYDRRFPETARHRIGGPQLLGAAAEAWQTADYRLLRDRLAQR